MHEMQSIVTDVCGVCLSVCLSCGSSRLHCAKMTEQIKMLFGVNTPGGPWSAGPDSPQRGGSSFKFCDPLLSPERLKLET